ncbi:MAG: helix-turn-helix domain-containing protein [Roseburia sp.]|nr:helix-turn-helix domain-containing protein [Roseburia sp.]
MDEYRKLGYLHDNFRIFHLSDTAQKEFTYHYHDFNKILILLNGDVTYTIEGRSYDLQANDIVFVKAGEVHKPIINSDLAYERIVIYVSPDYLDSHQKENADLNTCFYQAHKEQSHVLRIKSFGNSRLNNCIQRLEGSLLDKDFANELLHEILFLELMIELNRAALSNAITYIGNTASNKTILAIIEYLNTHLTEDISINTLAEQFYLSRYYLMHAFKEETGYTVGNYLATKRLLLAKDMIAAGKPITEVCYACGYKNYSTFSRAYKKNFGKAPRDMDG